MHIVDASNIERNLYLYTQLAELEVPIVLAMNMSDIVKKTGNSIDYDELSRLLGKPIVKTVGNKNKGMNNLLDSILELQKGKIKIEKIRIDYGEEINRELKEILKKLLGQKMVVPPAAVADPVRRI